MIKCELSQEYDVTHFPKSSQAFDLIMKKRSTIRYEMLYNTWQWIRQHTSVRKYFLLWDNIFANPRDHFSSGILWFGVSNLLRSTKSIGKNPIFTYHQKGEIIITLSFPTGSCSLLENGQECVVAAAVRLSSWYWKPVCPCSVCSSVYTLRSQLGLGWGHNVQRPPFCVVCTLQGVN